MSTDHKISSLYKKLTTLKEPELNAVVKKYTSGYSHIMSY